MSAMGDSPEFGAQGRDVRALFEKARIGSNRYVTFAAPKAPEAVTPPSEPARETAQPAKAAEETAVAPAAGSQSRRTLHSVVEVNSRLRMASVAPRRPVGTGAGLAFASCAGGVGKTTLCASIARALSARLNNILVADRCLDGIIPFFFSMERQSAGGLQTVYPTARRAGYPIVLVSAPSEEVIDDSTGAWLQGLQANSSITLLDLPTGGSAARGISREAVGHVIIPVLPDIQSVASIARAQALAGELCGGRVSFLLNRYQDARPLHREIRSHLENLLGDQLAPVVVSESEFVAEALSLGVTVLDHAPQSSVAIEVEKLANWLEECLPGPNSAPEKVGIA